MNNFAIALNAGTPTQRNEITNYLSNQKWAYWHWIDDFWVVQVPNDYTPKTLHDKLEQETDIDTPTMLIFEFTGRVNFWGRNKDEAWKWLDHLGTAK
ncbi:MAG: hypothetical protein RPU34_05890 [Candidatus Sedimenticola sp. (ex Thyasira tokunagai)]